MQNIAQKKGISTLLKVLVNSNFINFNKDDIQISSLTPELFEHFASFRKNQDNGGDNDIKYTISIIKSFIRKMDKRYEINLPNNFYNKIISIKSVFNS